MKGKVVLVSLRFNPAFTQFLIAYAKAVRELGHEASFLLDPTYARFPELVNVAPIFELGKAPLANSWTHAVFLNPSVENRELAAALKRDGTKILYVYHEPWQMSLRYLMDEGLLATLRAALAHHFTIPILKLADKVILASRYGLSQYQKADARFNRNPVYFPLIFDDDAPGDVAELLLQKRYFGYIGNLCRAHGFDQYLSFMRHALRRGTDLRFLIASRSPFPGHILNDPLISLNLDKIEMRCGRPLANDEMNRCYAESFCVWNIYRRSTQSAVLPKAFMFGTPVLASRIGSFPEYVRDGYNGRFAPGNDTESIGRALEDIRANPMRYVTSCRQSFTETFFYRSQLRDLSLLLEVPFLSGPA